MGKPIQIVLDTNVMVSAFRSCKGTPFALLRRVGQRRFKLNLSNTLLLEYEEKLKEEVRRQGQIGLRAIDKFLDYIVAQSNRCTVHGSLPTDDIHIGDQCIFDLAIASGASVIVTYNKRHFRGASIYGLEVMKPNEFLRHLERVS